MPPSMLPNSADDHGDDAGPKSTRVPRSRSKPRTAAVQAEQAPSIEAQTVPTPPPPSVDGEATSGAGPGRKAAPSRSRRASEQRAKVARRASSLLKFVSDPTRLQVLMILGEGEHHVGALCERLGQSQPAVSHHLALLRHGGVIVPRRAGKNNFYTLSDSGRELARVAQVLLEAE